MRNKKNSFPYLYQEAKSFPEAPAVFFVLYLIGQNLVTRTPLGQSLTELRPHLCITGFKTIRFFSPGLGRGDGGVLVHFPSPHCCTPNTEEQQGSVAKEDFGWYSTVQTITTLGKKQKTGHQLIQVLAYHSLCNKDKLKFVPILSTQTAVLNKKHKLLSGSLHVASGPAEHPTNSETS